MPNWIDKALKAAQATRNIQGDIKTIQKTIPKVERHKYEAGEMETFALKQGVAFWKNWIDQPGELLKFRDEIMGLGFLCDICHRKRWPDHPEEVGYEPLKERY